MTKTFKTLSVCCIVLLLSMGVKAQLSIIPQPLNIESKKGGFILQNNAVIGTDAQTQAIGLYLQNYLAQNYKLHLKLKVYTTIPANVAIKLVSANAGAEEAYTLKVSKAGVKIAGAGAGVFYGVQSLIQMLPANGGVPMRIAACTITDSPRFKWRGLSLDVSRHFFTVDEVKKYIDVMAHYKLNTFHWHLTDDEGWRIQIDKYPKLTEVGARISYYEKQGKFRKLDNLVDAGRDGFYTKADIREVLRYAAERYVTVLPEIEMPGHSEAAIFAYPELGCQDSTGAKHRVRMLDPSEHTFTFLQDVLTEVIALFPNQYIHIGGDEADMSAWLKSPVAVALMKKEGLKDEREVQSYFIKRIEKFLLSKNKKLIGWDEILQGGLAPSATVMSWQGEAGGIAAAKMHHQVVMTPLPQMYFDAPQANEELEPIGWNPPVTWQMVYNYEPMSKQLNPTEATYILGAQGNIWAEKVPNLPHLEYMVYPRALCVAELTWSAKQNKDIARFKYKMYRQYPLFKLWGFNARLPDIEGVDNVVTNKSRWVKTLRYPLKGAKVRYSINGKMPDSASAIHQFPLVINVPLKDTLRLSTYTTWTLNDQHIRQTALIAHQDINAVRVANAAPGLSYAVYKTKERDYNKISGEPIALGILTYPHAMPEATDEEYHWVKVSGYLKIPTEGDYELTSAFEMSPEIWVDDKPAISIDKNRYAEPQKALLHLKKGYYAIKAYYPVTEVNNDEKLLQLKAPSGRVLNVAAYLFH
ncbi:beta-N-acetylhexosaminidase [Inquilinus sp. KBS0705]|nr:beta-N-acetylhexosaminidase [Inquilinus sp. KBS0705]